MGKHAEHWLLTRDFNLEKASTGIIHVDIEAEFTMCLCPGVSSPVQCYSNHFEVYISLRNIEIYPTDYEIQISDIYQLFSPLYNISNHTGTEAEWLSRNNQTFSFHPNNSHWLTFAIRSRGACGSIFRMKMYYYECEELFIKGVHFQNVSSPITGFKNVIGHCSEQSVSLHNTKNQTGICHYNGSWTIPQEIKCLCYEGYYLSKNRVCLRK